MKKCYFAAFLLFFIFIGYSQESKKDYSESFNLIEVWLEAQKDFEQLPGISAIIIDDQEVLWTGAYGMANVGKNVETEPSTLYSICSISKLFTSVAIMKLYDERKLRLDDEIGDLLPWYDLKQQYPQSGPITIRGILTHSSGLPREANFPYWTSPDFPFPSREQIKAELSEQQTLYPSSTYFQYSNLGLSLLGEVIEEVSGVPYDKYIYENILEPLGMNNTLTELPESKYGNTLAVGYGAITREGKREKIKMFQAKGIKPAAGYSSNVYDLGKLASWQFRLMHSAETEILKSSTLKNMHNVHWIDPDWETTWGLGFNVYKGSDGDKWVGHGGCCPGYRTALRLNTKSKKAYSVMINANGTTPDKYVKGIHHILCEAEVAQEESTSSNKDFKEYCGYYTEQPWYAEVYISSWYGKLVTFELPADSPMESMTFFKHIESDTFQRIRDDEEMGEFLVFVRDKKGRINGYKWFQNYSKKIER